ncbi:BtrH N-terminal domain-containing protein [Aquabacter spiritensis]|uniref:Uncharacterized protein n=1 Tax=Aquabacter spiritensis TaxID=933073 RepID=A0A4R3LTR6_9HYPH|nr:BtrH N-terminal domain-containing protein [Aquabacter spiritensis]TCT03841.1 hypothetical protein EDC64_1086 [Aquabacter spiritensis]
MSYVDGYDDAYHSMTWMGPKGYPEGGNSGRCYFTGLLGMYRLFGEQDVLFADGTSGDGFSFRWTHVWGAPAFNGGAGPFHEIWEYTTQSLGFKGHWEEDHENGFDEAFAKLCGLVDRGIPVQVGLHYSLMLPIGAKTSPRLKFQHETMGKSGFGHHVVVAGYDLAAGTVTIFEPNDIMPNSRYDAPIGVFREAWTQAKQRGPSGYEPWEHHHPFGGEWSLHDGYGPFLMVWVEPGRDPEWDIAGSIRHSFRRNMKILCGDYPKPYALFGNQWQIPRFETGAPGMAAFAEKIRKGEVGDVLAPSGELRPLFLRGQIPNHGVLGRAGAAGYLRRVTRELGIRGLKTADAAAAADMMQKSSDTFRVLRYEADLKKAGEILSQIADMELSALNSMVRAWAEVKHITEAAPKQQGIAAE